MQNRKAIKVFAILFALVCLYQLSFTWKVSQVEKDAVERSLYVRNNSVDKAEEYASKYPAKEREFVKESRLNEIQKEAEKSYLDSISSKKVWGPYTFFECKQRELNLGLDLKGGMNVTLEVRVIDIIRALANYNDDENFNNALVNAKEAQENSTDNFLALFAVEYEKISPNKGLAKIFLTKLDQNGKIEMNSTNQEVIAVLEKEVKSAIDFSFDVLRTRIDRFGVTQPNIQRIGTGGQILVELPGIKDTERARKLLQSSAQLEFWETFDYGAQRDKEALSRFVELANNYLSSQQTNGQFDDSDEFTDSNANNADVHNVRK